MFFSLFKKLNYNKKFPYFICTPLVYGIGAASEHIAMASAHAKRTNKKLLIFKTYFFKKFLNYEVCNNALFDSIIFNNEIVNKKKFSYRLINFLIQVEFVMRRFLAIKLKSFFNFDIGEEFRFALLGSRDLYSEKKNLPYKNLLPLCINDTIVDIEKCKKKKCHKIIENLNLEKRKIVCLHVRDHGYYNDIGRRNYRNSNINNYVSLINYLIKKNYFVIRIGDKSAKKLKMVDKYFIDYPFTNLKSEIMDLYLLQICHFYIGTPSGPMDTAYLFNKPILLTNLYDIYPSFPRKRNDRGVFRKIIKKENGKILSPSEFANLSLHYHQTEVNINDYHFEENSSEELLNATKEFVHNLEQSENFKKKIDFDEKQILFNKFIENRLEEIYEIDVLKNNFFKNDLWKKNEFIKIVKRFKSCEGTYSLSTLKD